MAVVADAGVSEGGRQPDAAVRVMMYVRIGLYLVMVWSVPCVYCWLVWFRANCNCYHGDC